MTSVWGSVRGELGVKDREDRKKRGDKERNKIKGGSAGFLWSVVYKGWQECGGRW